MRDFTIEIFRRFLNSIIECQYTITTVQDYFNNPGGRKVILRHDVDASPLKSLEFATIEKEMGVLGSYYFRVLNNENFNEEIIAKIMAMGHEIGYHYEDLFIQKGNYNKAIQSFEKNLTKLRARYPVKTICMDGHVFSKWNNLDLWKQFDYHNFGIDGEPYLDIDFNRVLYITDTGRKWNATSFSLYDKVHSKFNYNRKTTHDLIKDLEAGKLPDQILITLHPQRWHSDIFQWLKEKILQQIKNPVRYAMVQYRENTKATRV